MDKTDDETHGETDERGLNTVRADARARTGRAEVVGHGRTGEHTEGEDAGIAVSFTCHEQLASGAAPGERKGEACGDHAEVVPQIVGVCHGLAFKAELEAAGQGVGDESGKKHGEHAEEQMRITEQEEIAEGTHGAEAAALGDNADHKREPKRSKERGMLRSRTLDGKEQRAALGLVLQLREEDIEEQQADDDGREDGSGNGALAVAAAKRIAALEEQRANPDACGQSGEAEDGVAVAAGETEDGAPRTAEENEGAHGGDHAEDKTDDWRGPAAGFEFPRGNGGDHGSEHKPHDFRPQILDDGGTVQPEPSGDVALEARHADAHVTGVSELLQGHGDKADEGAHNNDARCCRKGILHAFLLLPKSVSVNAPYGARTREERKTTSDGSGRVALSASEQTMRTAHRGFFLSSISCVWTALVHHP